jgi:hypothetical protein
MLARARFRALLVLLAGALAACSLAFPMDSFRGPSGAAVEVVDGSAVDAGADSGQASIDAADDGGPPSFTLHCSERSPIPKYCDDFERTSLLGNSWDAPGYALGGSATLDTNDSRSPIRSLLTTSPGGAGYQSAYLERHFPDVAASIVLGFDLKIAAPLPDGEVIPALIGLGTDGSSANHEISVKPDGSTWLEADYRVNPPRFYSHHFTREPAFGEWEHVTVALQLQTGASPLIKVTFEQDTVIDEPFKFPVSPSSFYLQVGLIYAANVNAAMRVHIDNVTLDWL